MPCDAKLLRGSAMVNELALTGEMLPARKYEESMAESKESASCLFSGTLSFFSLRNGLGGCVKDTSKVVVAL